jgi:micrococcal nuclease
MPPPEFVRYCYSATVLRVVDGDTVDLDLDLGCRVYRTERIRLRGIDAPEARGPKASPEGAAAHAHLASILTVGRQVLVKTHRDLDDKYGRLLADIWTEGADASVSERMLGAGHAVAYLA